MDFKTIRIKTLTSVSCLVRFHVLSCDSRFAGKNSGLPKSKSKFSVDFIGCACWAPLQQRVFVEHRQNLTDFTQIFDSKCLVHVQASAMINFTRIHCKHRKISLAKLDLSPRGCLGRPIYANA